MAVSINEIQKYLATHNIKPSYHRLRIFEYLVTNQSHPTVDDIYKALASEMPTLSKTTVYNTLNLFVEHRVAKALSIEENEMRYDVDITNHGHFKCQQCNVIYDFELDTAALDNEGLKDFQIHTRDVYYKGICPGCLANKNN